MKMLERSWKQSKNMEQTAYSYLKKNTNNPEGFRALRRKKHSFNCNILLKKISRESESELAGSSLKNKMRKKPKQSKVCEKSKGNICLRVVHDGVYEITDINRSKIWSKSSNNEEGTEESSEADTSKAADDANHTEPRDLIQSIALDHNYSEICKSLSFGNVSVFYFCRRQGCCTVPSDGEISLGMEMKHSEYKKFTLTEFEEAKAIQKLDKLTDGKGKKISRCENYFLKTGTPCSSIVEDQIMSDLADLPISSSTWLQSNGLFSSYCQDPGPAQRLSKDIFSTPPPGLHHSLSNAFCQEDSPVFPWTACVARRPADSLAGQAQVIVKQEKEVVDALSAACLQSFRAFHSQSRLSYEDDTFDTVKILEVVPEHINRDTKESNPNSKRSRNTQDCGSNGVKAMNPKSRISILRSHGIPQIDRAETYSILSSREECGCSCPGPCYPSSCSCAASGLQCCVETAGGPCKCAGKECYNQEGRRVFDTRQVHMHFITTIMDKGGGMDIT